MLSNDIISKRAYEPLWYEVFAVMITPFAERKTPTMLNMCTKREFAKEFIASSFPEFKPMPSFHANANGELGTVYYHGGMEIRIQKIPVGFGIYQWLLGAEHYQSPIVAAMA